MQYTVFKTPVFRHILLFLSWSWLTLGNWKIVGEVPKEKKFVLIAAPHTSNWDFPLLMAMACMLRFEIYWMGKDALFAGPFGPFMRWLGGIPIDRRNTNNVVEATVNAFNRSEQLIVVIPPEGTRSKVRVWKTGFYHIAVGANVPIGLSFLDFSKKEGGFMPTFYPTGNLESDIDTIKSYYRDVKGKYPNLGR